MENMLTKKIYGRYYLVKEKGWTSAPSPRVANNCIHLPNEGDIILDPFMGSGTFCSGKNNNRQYGLDSMNNNIKITKYIKL